MTGESHRISAGALRNRGMVTTSGRGPTWSAEITDAGREYLRLASSPNAPLPRQANGSVTQQLVDDLLAGGGSLRLPRRRWSDRNGVDFEQRPRMAQLHGKVPDGKWLNVSIVSGDELQVDLVEAPAGDAEPRRPVPVPEKVTRYHAIVRQLKDGGERHEVSRAALPRALRVVQALVAEAERRGYEVKLPSDVRDGYGRESWTGH